MENYESPSLTLRDLFQNIGLLERLKTMNVNESLSFVGQEITIDVRRESEKIFEPDYGTILNTGPRYLLTIWNNKNKSDYSEYPIEFSDYFENMTVIFRDHSTNYRIKDKSRSAEMECFSKFLALYNRGFFIKGKLITNHELESKEFNLRGFIDKLLKI
jgi:hypothetical protein